MKKILFLLAALAYAGPSLCFADAMEPSMTEEGEEKLQQVLDEDAYDLLLHPQKLKIRFRLEFFLRNR